MLHAYISDDADMLKVATEHNGLEVVGVFDPDGNLNVFTMDPLTGDPGPVDLELSSGEVQVVGKLLMVLGSHGDRIGRMTLCGGTAS